MQYVTQINLLVMFMIKTLFLLETSRYLSLCHWLTAIRNIFLSFSIVYYYNAPSFLVTHVLLMLVNICFHSFVCGFLTG